MENIMFHIYSTNIVQTEFYKEKEASLSNVVQKKIFFIFSLSEFLNLSIVVLWTVSKVFSYDNSMHAQCVAKEHTKKKKKEKNR